MTSVEDHVHDHVLAVQWLAVLIVAFIAIEIVVGGFLWRGISDIGSDIRELQITHVTDTCPDPAVSPS